MVMSLSNFDIFITENKGIWHGKHISNHSHTHTPNMHSNYTNVPKIPTFTHIIQIYKKCTNSLGILLTVYSI